MLDKPRKVEKSPVDKTDEIATSLLASVIRVDIRKGHVTLLGHPIILFRFEFLVAIQKQLETTIGASAKDVLYLSGERASEEVLPAMSERLKHMPSGQDSIVALRRMADIWATIGAGRATITEFDPAHGKFSFKIDDGPFPAAYGPSEKPVCFVWAGWAAGVAKSLFGRDVMCEEVRCVAMGHPACEFVIAAQP